MTDRTSAPTFVGPTVLSKTKPGKKEFATFYVLSAVGGGMIRLDYDSPREALNARRQILQAKNAFLVNSQKLMDAIQQAIRANIPAPDQDNEETDLGDNDQL